MKRFNQITAWFAIIFIGSTIMVWMLDKMVTFLGIMLTQPLRAAGYVLLAGILLYGLHKINSL